MDGEIREGDLRVPLIASFFFLSLIAGGVFLGIYVFDTQHSKPWFPTVALTLIAMPWIFWVLMYFYTCFKACFFRRSAVRVDDRQISRRKSMANEASFDNNNNNTTSEDDGKHVKFGGAVVMEGDSNEEQEEGGDASVASRESEIPLKFSDSSSSSS